jgi:hypothetical protein
MNQAIGSASSLPGFKVTCLVLSVRRNGVLYAATNVCFGSKGAVETYRQQVCFIPMSGRLPAKAVGPFRANRRLRPGAKVLGTTAGAFWVE